MADIFLPHRTQLKHLRNKNLEIPNGSYAMRILEREGYHTVINGYRDPFKATTFPEFKFLSGTTFKEVYSLYDFDRCLRSIYLKKILKIEQAIRSSIAYNFSKANRYNNRAYLDFRNFDYTRTHKNIELRGKLRTKPIGTDIHNVISNLSRKMSNRYNPAINHYITEHQSVPLWILINTMTMGDLAYLYMFLLPDQRNAISSEFNLSDNQLQWFIEQLKIYRNICAHEERFYCVSQNWGMTDIWHLYSSMVRILPTADSRMLERNLKALFKSFEGKFNVIPFSKITDMMGYPVNWHNN